MAVQTLHAVEKEILPSAPPPDTGAACLAIAAAVHRKPIDLVRLAHAMGRPGQPLTTAELVLGARRNGFRARAVRSRPDRLCGLPLADQTLRKERQREDLRSLRASVSGTVQDLKVHTLGGVVNAADSLLTLVPDDARLEVEAVLPHREAGFVHEGQHAEVKLEAFPFTRYGTVPGTVRLVSREATGAGPAALARSRPPAESQAGSTPDKGGYRVTVRLDRSTLEVDGRAVPLRSGIAAQVDVATGKRRVIAFLLDPVEQHRREAGHER